VATWTETKAWLAKTFTLAVDEAEWVGLAFKFSRPNGGEDILQKQRVEIAQAFGQPHLLIWSDIIEADRVPPRVALAHNMSLAIGGVAIHENLLVLRTVLPLENVDFAYLEKAMRYVAHEAARLRMNTPPSAA
jgi:hypothetical protein